MSWVTFEATRDDADAIQREMDTSRSPSASASWFVLQRLRDVIREQTTEPVVTFKPGQTVRSRMNPKRAYTIADLGRYYRHHTREILFDPDARFRSDAYELMKLVPDTDRPTFLESTS